MIDVDRHRVDAVKDARSMRCGEDGGGNSLSAAEIAPLEPPLSARRLDPGDECHMVEPRWRQHRLEVPQIRNVGGVTAIIARHLRSIALRGARGQVNASDDAVVEQSAN